MRQELSLSCLTHLLIGDVTNEKVVKERIVIGTDETILVDISCSNVGAAKRNEKELNLICRGECAVDIHFSKSLGGNCCNRTEVSNYIGSSAVLDLLNAGSKVAGSSDLEADGRTGCNILVNVEVDLSKYALTVELLVSGSLTEAGGSCLNDYEACGLTADGCIVSCEYESLAVLSIALEVAGYEGKEVCVVVKTKSDVGNIDVSCLILDGKLDLTAVYVLSAGNDSVVDLVRELDTTGRIGRNGLKDSVTNITPEVLLTGSVHAGRLSGGIPVAVSRNILLLMTGIGGLDNGSAGLSAVLATIDTVECGVAVLGTSSINGVVLLVSVFLSNGLVTASAESIGNSIGTSVANSLIILILVKAGSSYSELCIGLGVGAVEIRVRSELLIALGALVVCLETGGVTVRINLLNDLTELVSEGIYIVNNLLLIANGAVVVSVTLGYTISGRKGLTNNLTLNPSMTCYGDSKICIRLIVGANLVGVGKELLTTLGTSVVSHEAGSSATGLLLGNEFAELMTKRSDSGLGCNISYVKGLNGSSILIESAKIATRAIVIILGAAVYTVSIRTLFENPIMTKCGNLKSGGVLGDIVYRSNLLAVYDLNLNSLVTYGTSVVLKSTLVYAVSSNAVVYVTVGSNVVSNHAIINSMEGVEALRTIVISERRNSALTCTNNAVSFFSASCNCSRISCCRISILYAGMPLCIGVNVRAGVMLSILPVEVNIL